MLIKAIYLNYSYIFELGTKIFSGVSIKADGALFADRIYLHDGEISIIHFYTVIMSNPIWYNDFGLIDSVSQQLIFHRNWFCCHRQTSVVQLLKCCKKSFSSNLILRLLSFTFCQDSSGIAGFEIVISGSNGYLNLFTVSLASFGFSG